ncbi:hypothetical protein CCR75_000339 [Bremia lactucae]|uniref:Protein kinase domain-containing protein n=1 Tax=Bremia lactucae TaxID=4779 RepID=A0A976FKN1_BRELC|nr:hypothetical protein CCR75_000339 [Bremia lactucae]
MELYEPLGTLAPALYGSVEKWRHTLSGEYVAIKRMELRFAARKRSVSSESAVEENVIAEIKTNLQIQSVGGHSNVLPMRDCIMENEAVLLVLKFCENGELLHVLNMQRAAGKQINVLRYFGQILRGATFLHAHGIAHCDLSLENVLIDEYDCCQIADFGLAMQCSESTIVRPVGKLKYMAPEVSAALEYEGGHQKEYNPMMADVWALGVMLYAMVAAQYPFCEPTRRDTRFRLLEDFGVEYLLEKDEVDVTGKEQVVDLLKKLLVVNPLERSKLAELESHITVSRHESCEIRPASPTKAQSSHVVVQEIMASKSNTWQHATSRCRLFRKGETALMSANKLLFEAEKCHDARATLTHTRSNTLANATPMTSNTGAKDLCTGGILIRKCFATALA